LQILAGGTGLNLQHFSHVMFPSPHWNPTLEDQAICRCYRIGQKNSVRVYSFCLSEVVGCVRQIDHEIMSRQQSKRGIIATFMESGSDTRMVPVDAGMEATIEGDDEALTASQLPI
jgi:non-specific serine/threonine protein kinase